MHSDPDSRRAVIPIYSPPDIGTDSNDIPCTTTLQFLIRSGCLNMITTMRSNDIYLGLPYDVFNFTMLQELVACRLGVKLGTYHHFVGSMHYYDRDSEKINAIITGHSETIEDMPEMNPVTIEKELENFFDFEEQLRLTGKTTIAVSAYFQPLAQVLLAYRQKLDRKKENMWAG